MTLRFFDSVKRDKRDFHPINPDRVTMYVCGPTAYDDIHLGNARPLVVFDVLYRLLRYRFGRVIFVRNITDIDDKIIRRSSELGISTEELTRQTIAQFHEECAKLGILPVDHEPRATQYLAEMIAMIELLIMRGHAYLAEGHVLFSAASYPDYGRLSGRGLEDQIAGARIEVADYKRHEQDFVLWKPAGDDKPGWMSPWGRGRPGWHIECSAMSLQLLGRNFDIHGGGNDLLFPHHENERAQNCCAYPQSNFAQYWLHNGLVLVDGEKMSKSLGNFITLRAMLERYPGEIVRLLLLGAHYRKPMEYRQDKVTGVMRTLEGWYRRLAESDLEPKETEDIPLDPTFYAALCDDLNIPLALTRLSALARENLGQLRRCGQFLGLFTRPLSEVCRPKSALSDNPMIAQKIAEREAARKAKDFATADRLREELRAAGVAITDAKT